MIIRNGYVVSDAYFYPYEKSVPHKWTIYFLMAVGFWNFIGAGVFGFLIGMPIVCYYEAGPMLTPNHGHATLMGVFGMLGLAQMMFSIRQVLKDEQWRKVGNISVSLVVV